MNLVAYTVTALSRNDITETPKDANILAGATIELKDYNENLVVIYDDENGSNPETQKLCNSNGQRTIWADSGDYILEINGEPQYVSFGVSLGVLNSAINEAEDDINSLVLEASNEADRAEAAASAAILSADIYETTSDGLSATVNGDYFSVIGQSDKNYLDLYRNESGVADYKKSYPSSIAVDNLINEVNELGLTVVQDDTYALAVVDKGNKVIFSVSVDGDVFIADNFKVGADGSVNIADQFSANSEGGINISGINYNEDSARDGYVIVNKLMQILMQVKEGGEFLAGGVSMLPATVEDPLTIVDKFNQIAFKINKDGSVLIPDLVDGGGSTDDIEKRLTALEKAFEVSSIDNLKLPKLNALNQLLSYGQSLSVGGSSPYAISTTPRANDKMFNFGSLGGVGSGTYAPPIPYREGLQSDVESHQYGMLETIENLIIREDGVNSLSFLSSSAGEPSQPIAALSKGGGWVYDRAKAHINNVELIAKDDNQFIPLNSIFWIQGENDLGTTPVNEYKDKLLQLRLDLQSERSYSNSEVPLISYVTPPRQINQFNVVEAQTLAEAEDTYIFIACTIHFMEFRPDNVHLTSESYKLLGAYLGKAWKRIFIDKEYFKPTQVTGGIGYGSTVVLDVSSQNGGLIDDATDPTEAWTVSDDSGSLVVQSVDISNDTITLILDRSVVGLINLYYANNKTGKIRDTAKAEEYITIDAENVMLHNYLIPFHMQIEA